MARCQNPSNHSYRYNRGECPCYQPSIFFTIFQYAALTSLISFAIWTSWPIIDFLISCIITVGGGIFYAFFRIIGLISTGFFTVCSWATSWIWNDLSVMNEHLVDVQQRMGFPGGVGNALRWVFRSALGLTV